MHLMKSASSSFAGSGSAFFSGSAQTPTASQSVGSSIEQPVPPTIGSSSPGSAVASSVELDPLSAPLSGQSLAMFFSASSVYPRPYFALASAGTALAVPADAIRPAATMAVSKTTTRPPSSLRPHARDVVTSPIVKPRPRRVVPVLRRERRSLP